jgi:hypothetical protein
LKSFDIGISVGTEKICVLLYADDIVLLAPDEQGLQALLNNLNDWCNTNDMNINATKSNIVHFRPQSLRCTDHVFVCGNDTLCTVSKYTYLGIVISEHLDYNITAKAVAQSASRALGLLIAKCKVIGGLPYNVFSKLYDSVVWPVINYGACIWGIRSFSCINAVHNRAMRFFLGVGKYTPNDAVAGEMAWVPPIVRQWKTVAGYWARLCNMPASRLNKRVALWADSKGTNVKRNWYFIVKDKLRRCNLENYINLN